MVTEKGGAKFAAEVTSKDKGRAEKGICESCSAVIAVRSRLKLQDGGLKEAIKLLFPPLIYGGDDALPQTSAAPKNYGLASITKNRSSGQIPHFSRLILTNHLLHLL